LTPHWPKPYGRGAAAGEQVLIDEELDRAGVQRPDLVIGAWAAPTIIAHGTEEQIARFVPATLRGDIAWCQLFSEPGAGSDLAALRTTAERVDGGWKLNGQKVWNSLAVDSDWAICLARTDKEAPKHKGITYFLVDMKAPASGSARCARSPAMRCSTRCSSRTSSCRTTAWWARSTAAGAWPAPRLPTSGWRWAAVLRWARRWRGSSPGCATAGPALRGARTVWVARTVWATGNWTCWAGRSRRAPRGPCWGCAQRSVPSRGRTRGRAPA